MDVSQVWSVKGPNGGCPYVAAVNADQVMVCWMLMSDPRSRPRRNDFYKVQLLDIHSGSVMSDIDTSHTFVRIGRAQLCSGRLAISGETPLSRHDLQVWDVDSGKVLLKASNLLRTGVVSSHELISIQAFVLSESKVIFNTTKCDRDLKKHSVTRIVDYW